MGSGGGGVSHPRRGEVGHETSADELEEVIFIDGSVLVLINAHLVQHVLKLLRRHAVAERVHVHRQLRCLSGCTTGEHAPWCRGVRGGTVKSPS